MKLVCSSCMKGYALRRMHVLPGWVVAPDEPGQFVIVFRCHACWPAAIDDTEHRVADWADVTASGMRRFLDAWEIRDYIPGLADASDREAATRLVAIVRESGGQALVPLVVPEPGALGVPRSVERVATNLPTGALVRWCLMTGLVAAGWGLLAPDEWRVAGAIAFAAALFVPRLCVGRCVKAITIAGARRIAADIVFVASFLMILASVRRSPWTSLVLVVAAGLYLGAFLRVHSRMPPADDDAADPPGPGA